MGTTASAQHGSALDQPKVRRVALAGLIGTALEQFVI
jgi:hypothetical protein